MRALIADDQPDVVEALRLLLKQEGYQIETANSPAAVLANLSAGEFDLLLMDLNYARDTTSGQEGLDLLRSVRKLDRALPVVVMTAWGSVPLAMEAVHNGAQDFVEKPWDNSQLLFTLQRQIRSAAAEREELRETVATQHALLPKTIPQIPDCDFSASWTPAGSVGGDYLDLVPLEKNRLGICVGDASGKGVSAALMMSNLQAAVRALAPDAGSTDILANRLNRILCANTAPNKFITLFYGVLDGRASPTPMPDTMRPCWCGRTASRRGWSRAARCWACSPTGFISRAKFGWRLATVCCSSATASLRLRTRPANNSARIGC